MFLIILVNANFVITEDVIRTAASIEFYKLAVNNFVKDLISQKKDLILETFNNDIPDFNRTYKNNLLSFIYQNELKTFDIDAITNYKGVPVRSGVNIVTIESVMKLNSGVGVKKVDEKNIKLNKEVEIFTIELRNKLTIIEDVIIIFY